MRTRAAVVLEPDEGERWKLWGPDEQIGLQHVPAWIWQPVVARRVSSAAVAAGYVDREAARSSILGQLPSFPDGELSVPVICPLKLSIPPLLYLIKVYRTSINVAMKHIIESTTNKKPPPGRIRLQLLTISRVIVYCKGKDYHATT